jgi:multiple sugar transport system ATP-binding protein
MSEIVVTGLSRSFGGVDVLKGIDLTVGEGEFVVLLGPSGCGKSTLLGLIAGLDQQSDGSVRIGGREVTDLPPDRRGLAMVFQSYALYPTMTVRRNLSFGLRVARLPKAEIAERVDWVAGLLQIRELLDRKPSQLSGGQRQRVAIGRALARRAGLYLFDEPLSNLDAKLRNEMRIEIRQLHAELGATALYVTHDQVEAMTLATRIALMNRGRIEQFAAPQELYDRPATIFAASFIGSPQMSLLSGRLVMEEAEVLVETSEGRIPVGGYGFARPPVDGRKVRLGFRPEDVSLRPGPGAPVILGRHRLNEPLGADTLAWFDHAGGTFAARLEPAVARDLSGEVALGLRPDKLSIFDNETEQRL